MSGVGQRLPRRVLVTGITGQVGAALLEALPRITGIDRRDIVGVDRAALDLSDPDAIVRVVREVKPELIINPGAYTAVDQAEKEPELALAVNGRAPGILAEEAKRLGAVLFHYSTDYVFDGNGRGPYSEDAPTAPLGVYGASKLAGEQAIAEVGATAVVGRTTWVYAARGKNFLLTIRRLAREREELRVVADQHGAPNWAQALADATAQAVALGLGGLAERAGVYHLTCEGQTTWHGFAERIVAMTPGAVTERVVPITTAEYPLPAKRPLNSVLSTAKWRAAFGFALPDWEDAFAGCLAELNRDAGTA